MRKELQDIAKDATSGVSAEPYGDNIRHLRGTIRGPVDTPYERGVFGVDIVIPDTYPFEPPKMRFMTKVWHPNVSSQTGAICLDILKDQWSPALTIKARARGRSVGSGERLIPQHTRGWVGCGGPPAGPVLPRGL